jgi:hypothetical protein
MSAFDQEWTISGNNHASLKSKSSSWQSLSGCLLAYTVWSSAVHAAIMGVQALSDTAERGHLVGDVPGLILVAIILAVWMPRTATTAVLAPRTAQA